ncbi:MAG TPA: class I SAM-dependent methyltransferase [Candidatus Limnocylindrales bacterium]|nr:class I SAM-dependent methyltransferase [Candidatus Limnocylindrales bacterium]
MPPVPADRLRPRRPRSARPPAGGFGEALARLYDIDLEDDPGDLDLYRALVARSGGPVLELAVGTGRLAVPLAADGATVVGVDHDAAMLARARARAERARLAPDRLLLVEGDLRTTDVPFAGSFRLAFIALNSLMLLAGRAEQAAAIRSLAERLGPDGLAVVDVWLPDADDLVRFDGRLVLEYVRDRADGTILTKTAAARHDAATGAVDLTAIYDESRDGVAVGRWIRRDRLRLVSADDLAAFAEAAGLEIEVIAGGYDLEPLGPGADRAVLLARRPA